MAKSVKLSDIAEMIGVSTVTVSKALSGKKGVSEAVRRQIQQKADELGYRQPSVIRREQEARTYTIGVLIASRYLDQYTSFYWKMYQELSARAAGKECVTSLEIISDTAQTPPAMPRLLSERLVDGYVILGPVSRDYLAFVTGHTDLPAVYLDGADREHELDCVMTDNYYGMYKMTNYLLERGHERIAYVGSIGSTESITDRYFGYAKALTEKGIPLRPEWVLEDRDARTGVADHFPIALPVGARDLQTQGDVRGETPTAYVCNCDRTAARVITMLEEKGYRVPRDVSVVGFDNYLYPGLCDVEITTYEVDMREMVSRALYMLRRKIAKEYYKKGVTVIGGRLVEKASVRSV
ncbi:MAG: substrate-binding domain-containing protein [Eubacteriales bacterium]|nr:substrate-binding domain-containing protein [Eubacteriales bacterium]